MMCTGINGEPNIRVIRFEHDNTEEKTNSLFLDFMDFLVPFCGSAKTSLHNQVFLEGVKTALVAPTQASSAGICKGENFPGGNSSWTEEQKSVGLKALGRVYAGWGFSQAFYREKLYESALGFKDLEDFMVNFWEAWGLSKGLLILSSAQASVQLPSRQEDLWLTGWLV